MADENKQVPDEQPDEAIADDELGEGQNGGFDAKKIILFVVAPVLLLIGAGGGLYFSGMLDSLMGGGEKQEGAEEEKNDAKKDGAEKTGAFLEIPPMIVNLNTGDGPPRYLRLTVQLELEDEKDIPAVEAAMPRVIDQFQTYLRELRVQDLSGSAGLYRVQVELLWRVNRAAAPVKVKDVLFQEILIQ